MKTGILLFEQYHGKKDIGSSRIRGHWIIRNWGKAGEDIGTCEAFKHGGDYDVVIYQKAYFTQHANAFKGIKIFDICDPDWYDWSYPVKEMLEACDAVTCSSLELTKAIQKFTKTPCYFIPDRIDFSTMLPPKKHYGETKTVVWYGYSSNFSILTSTLPALKRRNLDLIVVSDDVYVQPSSSHLNITNLPWSEHWMSDIQKGDIVINPQSKLGRWKYKSDNKTSIANALGMPVAHTDTELDKLLTGPERIKAAEEGYERSKKAYDVLLSVIDLKDVIKEIQHGKNN